MDSPATDTPAAGGEVPPWAEDPGVVAGRWAVDPRRGLTRSEARDRLVEHGPNLLEEAEAVPAWRKLLAQFLDPLVYLLLVAVAISLAAWLIEGADGVPFEVVVIAAVLVANAVLGYAQEAKAAQAVAALARMAAAQAGVVRDGEVQRVAAADVVPGDVLALAEGDAVAADARLVEAAALKVAEAALTGESEPVLKDVATLPADAALGDRLDMVFSGTAVSSGRGRAIVTATGMDSEMGHVARLLGPGLLGVAQPRVGHQHHGEHDDLEGHAVGTLDQPGGQRDDHRHKQQVDEGVLELGQQLAPGWHALGLLEHVGAVVGQPVLGFGLRQAALRVDGPAVGDGGRLLGPGRYRVHPPRRYGRTSAGGSGPFAPVGSPVTRCNNR